MTTSQIGMSHCAPKTIFADVSVLTQAKDTENYSALLSNIKLVDSSAVNAFKKQSNETFLAHTAFDDLVQSSLPSEFRNAKLSDNGEDIKNLLGMISPHISTQKDKDKFNLIINTLIKANGKEKKEQVVDKALFELVISCGKAPFEACLAKFYALCVEAWKAAHPDMQGDMTHDRVFTEEWSRVSAMLNTSVSNMASKGNKWMELRYHTLSFKADVTSLAKAIKFVEAPTDPQPANQAPNPERPAVGIPNAGLGDGMKGWPGIHFAPVVHGATSIGGAGGSSSITGGHHSPDARSHGGFDLNTALDTILTNDGLTEANRVKLANDAMDLYRDFLKANSGVLSNLSSVTGHAPESMHRNPSTQNNSASLHDTSTGNDATASLAGMPAGSASQVSDDSELQAELDARLLALRSFDNPLVEAGQSSTGSATASTAGARSRSASLASNGSDQTAEQLDTDAVPTSAAGARARSASLASNGSGQTVEQLDTDAVSTSAARGRSRSASLASDSSDQTAEQLDTDAVSTSAARGRSRSASLAGNGSDQTAAQLDTDAVSASAAGALAGSANQLRNGSLSTELEEKLATRRSLSVEDIEAKVAENRQRNLNNPQSVSPSAATSAAGASAGLANQLRNGSLSTELEEKLATRRSLSVEDIEAKVAENRQRNLNNPQSVSPSATTSAAGTLAGSANQLRNGSLSTELEEKLATRRPLSVEDVEDIEAKVAKNRQRNLNNPQSGAPSATTSAAGAANLASNGLGQAAGAGQSSTGSATASTAAALAGSANQLRNGSLSTELEEKLATRRSLSVEDVEDIEAKLAENRQRNLNNPQSVSPSAATSAAGASAGLANQLRNGSGQTVEQSETDAVSTSAAGSRSRSASQTLDDSGQAERDRRDRTEARFAAFNFRSLEGIETPLANDRHRNNPQSVSPSATTSAAGTLAGSANQLRNGSLSTELEEKLATRRPLSVEDVEDIEAKVAKNRQRNLNNPQSGAPSATTSAAGAANLASNGLGQAAGAGQSSTGSATASTAAALAGSANQLRNGSLSTELEEKLATRRSLSVEDIEAKVAENRQRNLNNPQSGSPSATTSAAGASAGLANQLRNGSGQTVEQSETDAVSTSAAGSRSRSASQTLDDSGQAERDRRDRTEARFAAFNFRSLEGIETPLANDRHRNNPQSVSPSATTSAAGTLAGSANQLRNGSLSTELEEKLATRRPLSVEDVEDIEAKLAENRQRNLNNPQSGSPSATTSAAGAANLASNGLGQAARAGQSSTGSATASTAGVLAGSANQLRNGSLSTELEEKLATRRPLSVEDVEDIEAKLAENRQRNLNNPQSGSPSATTSAAGAANLASNGLGQAARAGQSSTGSATASTAGALSGSANQLRNGSLSTELEEKLATRRPLSVKDIDASFVKSKNRHMQGARGKANLQRKIDNRNLSNVVASRRTTEQMPVNGSSAQFFQRNSPLQKSASLPELRSSELATRRKDDFVYTTQRQPDFFRFRNSSDNVVHFIPTASNSGRNSDRLSAIDKPQQKETLQGSRDGFLDVHNDTNESLA